MEQKTRASDCWRNVKLGVSVQRPAADGANDDGGRAGRRSDKTTATRRPGGRSAEYKSSRELDPHVSSHPETAPGEQNGATGSH